MSDERQPLPMQLGFQLKHRQSEIDAYSLLSGLPPVGSVLATKPASEFKREVEARATELLDRMEKDRECAVEEILRKGTKCNQGETQTK